MKKLSMIGIGFLLSAVCVCADEPATTRKVENPWGQRAGANGTLLQARVTVTGGVSKGGAIPVEVELRNTSDAALSLADVQVWVMVAQGKEKVWFTEANLVEKSKRIEVRETFSMVMDGANLSAYAFEPTLAIKDGVPSAADDKPLKPLGTLRQILPAGRVRVKAFVVVTTTVEKKHFTDAIPSNTVDLVVAEGEFEKLDEVGKKAAIEEVVRLFSGDAVAGKSGHDRALKIGQPLVEPLVEAMDGKLSDAGRMWAATTLVDLGDKRAVGVLVKELEKGGGGAYVVAYHGPRMKNAELNAAIEKAAGSAKDAKLVAWAARGLGKAGKSLDGKALEAMVVQSDSAGRMEAVEILLEQKDRKVSGPLLAKLVEDKEVTVAVFAMRKIGEAGRRDAVIVAALKKAELSKEKKVAEGARETMKVLGG